MNIIGNFVYFGSKVDAAKIIKQYDSDNYLCHIVSPITGRVFDQSVLRNVHDIQRAKIFSNASDMIYQYYKDARREMAPIRLTLKDYITKAVQKVSSVFA